MGEINVTEYNFNNVEALKLMLDGKVVISKKGYIYKLHLDFSFYSHIILNKSKEIIDYKIDINQFLISTSLVTFKEYIEPKKPRKFEFVAYLGEESGFLPYQDKYALHKAFSSHVSSLFNEKKDVEEIQCYKKISKFKVTMEEILE